MKLMYECELCNHLHKTEEEALSCEATHKESPEIENTTVRYRTPESKYPSVLYAKFKDNYIKRYIEAGR